MHFDYRFYYNNSYSVKRRLAKDKGSPNLPIDSNDENGKRRQNSAFGRHAATTSFDQYLLGLFIVII